MKLRKSPRLRDFHYTGPFAYHLTFATRERLPIFKGEDEVQPCLYALKKACERYDFHTLAFCFMPDHLHLLLGGQGDSSLHDFVRYFKQISGYHFKRRYSGALWQISYYDHVVRRSEDVEEIAAYIWNNPVREGLAESRLDYALSGPRELMGQA